MSHGDKASCIRESSDKPLNLRKVSTDPKFALNRNQNNHVRNHKVRQLSSAQIKNILIKIVCHNRVNRLS